METAENCINEQQSEEILKNLSIPPCPGVVIALQDEVQQPDVDFHKLSKLISGDVGLAASMLKMANSPFFALRNKVETVQMAVSVLGLKNIVQIVRGSALRQALGGHVSMARFWDRSNFTAIVASKIAAELPDISREDAYTCGLFHDCGIPVLMQKFPDYKQTLSKANQSTELFVNIEDQAHATNHAVVGSMLARSWFLPRNLCQAILLHHDHSILKNHDMDSDVRTFVAIILIAEHIAATFLNLPDDAEWFVGGPLALEYLGYSNSELGEITAESLEELSEIQAYRGDD